MADNDQDNKTEDKPTKSTYGKRPLWQWILIYVVIAIVVYGLIYLLFFRSGSKY